MPFFPPFNPTAGLLTDPFSTASTPTATGTSHITSSADVDDCKECREHRRAINQPIQVASSTPHVDTDRVTEAGVRDVTAVKELPSAPGSVSDLPAAPGSPSDSSGRVDRVANNGDYEVENGIRTAIPKAGAPIRPPVRNGDSGDLPAPGLRTGSVLVRPHNQHEARDQRVPVWQPFVRGLAVCAPGCVPFDYAAYSNRGDGGLSCHNTGAAMDVHGITCGGITYCALRSYSRSCNSNENVFANVVACMKRRMPKVLFHEGPRSGHPTSDHYDHAHFSIGCHGGRYW